MLKVYGLKRNIPIGKAILIDLCTVPRLFWRSDRGEVGVSDLLLIEVLHNIS